MVRLENVSKTYIVNKNKSVEALKNVNLDFEEKGLVFILGKSGCGKTTLLNIIGGLDSATSGNIYVNERPIDEFGGKDFDTYRNYQVGFVFQEYNLIDEYNVRDNIALALELQNCKEKQQKIDETLKQVELSGFAEHKVKQLSGGQKQRVSIARALVKDPMIILADEPTGNLDSTTSDGIYKLLKDLSRDKLIIVVTHDSESAEIYGDRIVKMKDGQIVDDRIINKIQEERNKSNHHQNIIHAKNSISFKNIFKMSFKNLWKVKFRMLVTMVLFIATLSIIGCGISVMLKSPGERYSEIYKTYDTDCFSVKVLSQADGNNELSASTIRDLKQFGHGVLPIYYLSSYMVEDFSYENNRYYYRQNFNGFVYADSDGMQNSGLQLIAGRLPDSTDKEFCITLFTAQSILNNETDYCNKNNINEVKDLVDKQVTFRQGKGTFKICGIIDTRVSKRFDKLIDDTNEAWIENMEDKDSLYSQYDEYMYSQIHSCIFVNECFNEYYLDLTHEPILEFEGRIEVNIDGETYYQYPNISAVYYKSIVSDELEYVGEGISGDDEIILSQEIFGYYMADGSTKIDLREDGYYYIDINFVNDDFTYTSRNLKIKGYLKTNDDVAIISNNVYGDFNSESLFKSSRAQIYLNGDNSDGDLLEFLAGRTDVTNSDLMFEEMRKLNSSIKYFSDFIKWIILGVLVFTILMMLNFIISTINSTKREMGILRAIGAKQSMIFAIYFLEMLIMCLIAWLLSIFVAMIISSRISYYMLKDFVTVASFAIMPINLATVSLMLIISVVIAFTGTVIPILAKSNKKPVELFR